MMNNPLRPAKAVAAFALAVAASSASALPARVAGTPAEALQLLNTAVGGALTSRSSTIDAYATVQALPGRVLLVDDTRAAPLARAQNFLASYGALSGVTDPLNQLALVRTSKDRAGNTHVHLNQMERGLPVFGARLVVHMNDQGVTGLNGVFIEGLDAISLTPAKSVADLRERALAAGRKLHPGQTLQIESTRLMFFRSGLLKGVDNQKNHLAYEVILNNGGNRQIRERIILDANTGYIVQVINEVHTVLHRKIYTPNYQQELIVEEGDATAPADPPLKNDNRTATSSRTPNTPYNNLYVFAGGTWQMYKNLFGRDGYNDGAEGITPANQVQESVYAANGSCPNASWNGTFTYYCPGFDADDVVSHEWSHAYTEYTHGLVYAYQSGALNEGYSDIFGETYDLANGIEGVPGVTLTEGDYYVDRGNRWVVGEDLSEAVANVLLRDMWDPDNFAVRVNNPSTGAALVNRKSPGSVITSPNYYCGSGDGGGVHFNSGVPNHAYAMLVDGKNYNGVDVPGIGLIKAAHIYFQAETHYQTPTTNFAQHADSLEKACADLIGKPLNDILGAPSDQVINAADCAAVSKTVLATEMRGKDGVTAKEKCGYKPVLLPEAGTPATCGAGLFEFPTFKETWESGIPSTWTQTQNLSGDTAPEPFEWVLANAPAPHTGKAVFADNNGLGTCAAGGDRSAAWAITSPEITVPDDASFLSFKHYVQSELGYDGGNLKFSVNGGAFAVVPANAFTYNAHSGEFEPAPLFGEPSGQTGNNTNPKADEGAAWTGADQGEASGSWGTTVVDISKLTGAPKKGAKVKFRWEFGQDGCGGNLGWFVDDTQVFYCSKTAPTTPTTPTTPTNPGPVTPPVVTPTPATNSSDGTGRFGGGSFGALALLPLAAMALRRRRKLH